MSTALLAVLLAERPLQKLAFQLMPKPSGPMANFPTTKPPLSSPLVPGPASALMQRPMVPSAPPASAPEPSNAPGLLEPHPSTRPWLEEIRRAAQQAQLRQPLQASGFVSGPALAWIQHSPVPSAPPPPLRFLEALPPRPNPPAPPPPQQPVQQYPSLMQKKWPEFPSLMRKPQPEIPSLTVAHPPGPPGQWGYLHTPLFGWMPFPDDAINTMRAQRMVRGFNSSAYPGRTFYGFGDPSSWPLPSPDLRTQEMP